MLDETLRNRYDRNETADFHQEFRSRLGYLRHLIESLKDDDPEIPEKARELNYLSYLITCIERSHLEEFAWPFAESLKRISRGVCANVDFFFRAEGGLWSYEVVPEEDRPGIFARKIEPVVFPRALKESVLLHTIIGHEFGHAALASQPVALRAIADSLVQGSPAEDRENLFSWCAANTGASHRYTDDELDELVTLWAEEFFCDLFGLVTMGPAFLPAFQAVLEAAPSTDPYPYVPTHPPVASRAASLLHAARALQLLYSEQPAPGDLGQQSVLLDKAFVALASKTPGNLSILDPQRVSQAAVALAQFTRGFPPLAFPAADAHLISQLVRSIGDDVPPVGTYPAVSLDEKGKPSLAECDVVDFRHILLAGWLSWLGAAKDERFAQINSLCSHAIMQQEGIAFWAARNAKLVVAQTP